MRGAYFTRGSGHDEAARYSENPDVYARNMERLAHKHDTARTLVPQPVLDETPGAEVGIIAYGSSHWAVLEARAELKAAGIETSYLLVRGLPFAPQVAAFVRAHPRVYVVDQNRDGQMADLVRLETPDAAARVRTVRHFDGLPLDAASVSGPILEMERALTPVAQGASA